ncbi:MAG: class I SAM-dependent methyltransferase [bacterium]
MREYRDRIYSRYFSATYSAVNRPTDESYRASEGVLRQVLLPFLPKDTRAIILDVACGIGYALHMLKNAGYVYATGIDISPEQVEIGLERGLPIEKADVFDYLANVRDRYDALLALDFLEHLDRNEILHFLDLAAVALRPGGRIIVRTANANSPCAARVRYGDLTHELIFTELSLRGAFVTCGLHPIHIGGGGYRPFTALGWLRWLTARTVQVLWKGYLIAELGREGVSIPTEFHLIGVAERRP